MFCTIQTVPRRYTVPVAHSPVPQPLQVAVGASLTAIEDGQRTGVLLGATVQLAPQLVGALKPAGAGLGGAAGAVCACVCACKCMRIYLHASARAACAHSRLRAPAPPPRPAALDVRLSLPPLFELPLRVTPPGATLDGAARTLTWRVVASSPLLASAAAEPVAFSAAFVAPAGLVACQGALRNAHAEVHVAGAPGATLTGLGLLQHGFHGTEAAEAACGWSASVVGRPRIPKMR